MKNIVKRNYLPPCETCDSRENSSFCVLKLPELELLTKSKSHFHYKKGQTIFYENSQVLGIYCIYAGKVLIHKQIDAREQVVRMARPGNWLGYRALLSEEAYSASATALDEVQACFIPKAVFMGLLTQSNNLAIATLQVLAKNLKTAEVLLTGMVHKQADARIAETLMTLGEFYGYEDDKMTINVRLSRVKLSEIAGVTTETAIRVLSSFNKAKIIRLTGKKIKLLDMQKLQTCSNK